MVQSISLDFQGLNAEELTRVLYEVNKRITPDWIKSTLRSYRIPNSPCPCGECEYRTYDMADAYGKRIPTKDLTLILQPLPEKDGTMLYGSSSGYGSRDKMIIKVIVLKEVQEMFKNRGISSNLDMSDVWDSDIIEHLISYGVMSMEEIEQSKLYGSSKSQQNTLLTIPIAQSYNPDMKIEGVVVDIIDTDISKN